MLYFIQAGGRRGPIKIGHSISVKARLDSLQCGNPQPLRVLCARDFEGHERALESWWHRVFAEDRIRGEWFRCTDKLRLFIWFVFCTDERGQPIPEREREVGWSGVEDLEHA